MAAAADECRFLLRTQPQPFLIIEKVDTTIVLLLFIHYEFDPHRLGIIGGFCFQGGVRSPCLAHPTNTH
jgi:hypothetical protein